MEYQERIEFEASRLKRLLGNDISQDRIDLLFEGYEQGFPTGRGQSLAQEFGVTTDTLVDDIKSALYTESSDQQ